MVHVTRLNHAPLVLNADLIEHIESTPDTVITLTNGQKFMVLETSDELIARIVAYRREVANAPSISKPAAEERSRDTKDS